MGLDSAQFERGVKRTKKSASSLEKSVASMAKRLSVAIGGIAGVSSIRATQKMIDDQAKLGQSLGSTVEALQNMSRAGDLAGVSMSGIEQATKDLQRRLSQAAAGGGPAADALKKLRLSASNLLSLDLDDRVSLINERIKEFVPAAQSAAVAGQLFGEEGSIAMSRIDPATIRQATQDIRDFGVAVSEQDAEQIERMNDAVSRMGLAWTGIKNQLAVSLAPAFEAMANAVSNVAIALNKAREQLAAMTAVTERMIPYAKALAVIWGVKTVAGLTASAIGYTKNIISLIRLSRSFVGAGSTAAKFNAALYSQAVLGTQAATVMKRYSFAVLAAKRAKQAFMSVGITGALVVGAGELINFMSKLIKGAGGVGNAFKLLGNVAVEFGKRYVMTWKHNVLTVFGAVDSMTQKLAHFGKNITSHIKIATLRSKANFLDLAGSWAENISGMMGPLKGFINPMIGSFAGGFNAVRAIWSHLPTVFKNIGAKAMNNLIATIQGAIGGVIGPMNSILSAVGMSEIPTPDFSAWRQEVSDLGNVAEKAGDAIRGALTTDYVGVLGDIGAQGKEAAAALRDTASQLQAVNAASAPDFASKYTAQAKAIKDALSQPWESMQDLRAALRAATDDFDDMGDAAVAGGGLAAGALDDVGDAADSAKRKVSEVVQRITSLIDNLTKSFGDFVVGGFRDFKGMLSSMLDSFKSTISEMIATASKNKILVSLGISSDGSAAGGIGKLGGVLGKILPGVSALAGGVGAGFGSVLSGFATSGLAGAGSAISAALSGATAGMAGLGGAIGALAGPVGLAVVAISAFKKKTEIMDLGLQVTVAGMDTLVQQFKTVKTSRFFGLSKKISTELENATAAVANPIQELVATMQGGIADAATSLGVGASVFDDFAASIKLSTKGLSDDEIAQRLSAEINKLGDNFAAMIPGLQDFAASGEGAQATLTRLTTSLDAVNNMSAYLGNALRDMSVMGGWLCRPTG